MVQAVAERLATPRELGIAYTALTPINGLVLTDEQAHAVAGVIGHSLVVLTGGLGTEKTTVVKVILATVGAHLSAPRMCLVAPTGKAARRLSESTEIAAPTIHRLFEWAEDGRKRTGDNSITADLVVVDEASMVDLTLTAAPLVVLPTTCRLVLVGTSTNCRQ